LLAAKRARSFTPHPPSTAFSSYNKQDAHWVSLALLEAAPPRLDRLEMLLLQHLLLEIVLRKDLVFALPNDIVGQIQLAPRRMARFLRTARIPRAPLGDGYLQERGQRVRLDRSAAALEAAVAGSVRSFGIAVSYRRCRTARHRARRTPSSDHRPCCRY